MEKLYREGRFHSIAAAKRQNSGQSFRPNLLWADRPLTVARSLEKMAIIMEHAGTHFVLVGPSSATNLPGVKLPDFDPGRPADSIHEQLRPLFQAEGIYTLLIDLTGDEQNKVIANSANRRFWKRIDTIVRRYSPVMPAYTIVGATTKQVPLDYRKLAEENPLAFLSLPKLVLHRIF